MEQLAAIKAFAKALKMSFETKEMESLYDPEFVAKIKQSEQQVREGKNTRIKNEDLNNYLSE
ncbi:DUF2683 family protein [Pedobacter psychroterrae]|uniref:Uncharacterized protein n=1 Tax=Pedobacter psychroterrae TaxID=2530453 RepID=A0A4R0NEA3_9SPHI|nr:DUF2683 family protein [Pedobacter psychroterrae]TCC97472.1 hypothetical protein EZ437_20510 [Pedobacter psychroterrae]